MMSKEQFEQLVSRLDTLIKITAINAFQGKSRADVVRILSELGFQNKDIAMILATTPAYVAKVKYEFKKQRKKERIAETADTKEGEQK
jgi:predicted transcriptional regulator